MGAKVAQDLCHLLFCKKYGQNFLFFRFKILKN